MKNITRLGETGINTMGSTMYIAEYKDSKNITIYFPDSKYFCTNTYQNFKNGLIKNLYDRTVFGVGCLGSGDYQPQDRPYNAWIKMIERCYSPSYQLRKPTYVGCSVCEEWLCYQNFAKWYEANYYTINTEIMCLDKDILHKGNKVYSPNTCVFVPNRINTAFALCKTEDKLNDVIALYKDVLPVHIVSALIKNENMIESLEVA